MNNFKQRVLTGIGLIIVILLLTNLGMYSFVAMIAIINLMALTEFYRLVAVSKAARIMGLILGTSLILTVTYVINDLLQWRLLLVYVPFTFTIFFKELYAHHTRPFENLAYIFMGVIYITLPFCFFIGLAFLPIREAYNASLITGCFLIIWAGDTGAYLAGKLLGKNLVFKRISPKKTWEGCIGGVLSAIITAAILSKTFLILSTQNWIILSGIISVTGIYGDFFKSMLKRSQHIKDTGNILPGHGGILDRFDSLLGSAGFAFCYLLLYGQFKN